MGSSDAIKQKHITAKELQHRIKSSSMIAILQKIVKINVTLINFSRFWTMKIGRMETSVVRRIDKAITKSIHMANGDVGRLFTNISDYIDLSNHYLAPSQKWVLQQFDKANSLILDLGNLVSRDTGCSPAVERTRSQAFDVLEEIKMYFERNGDPRTNNNIKNSGIFFFPTYTTVESKTDISCMAYRSVAFLSDEFNSFGSANDCLKDYNNLDKPFNVIQHNLIQCLSEYRDYLQDTAEWLHVSQLAYNARYAQQQTKVD